MPESEWDIEVFKIGNQLAKSKDVYLSVNKEVN